MLKQSRHERKCLKAAKDHFTSAKLLHTHLRDRFYKTLHWDFYSHVPPLTVVHFVLQYLPKIYILSPSQFPPPPPPCCFLPPLFSPSVPLSPLSNLPGEGGAGSAADVGGGAEEARGGREEAPGWDGPQAEAGGGGGEDEREALLPGQWSSGRRREGGREGEGDGRRGDGD